MVGCDLLVVGGAWWVVGGCDGCCGGDDSHCIECHRCTFSLRFQRCQEAAMPITTRATSSCPRRPLLRRPRRGTTPDMELSATPPLPLPPPALLVHVSPLRAAGRQARKQACRQDSDLDGLVVMREALRIQIFFLLKKTKKQNTDITQNRKLKTKFAMAHK